MRTFFDKNKTMTNLRIIKKKFFFKLKKNKNKYDFANKKK